MSLAHLGHDILRDIRDDEFDPRGSDICPQCGSGHTTEFPISFRCEECLSIWEKTNNATTIRMLSESSP